MTAVQCAQLAGLSCRFEACSLDVIGWWFDWWLGLAGASMTRPEAWLVDGPSGLACAYWRVAVLCVWWLAACCLLFIAHGTGWWCRMAAWDGGLAG